MIGRVIEDKLKKQKKIVKGVNISYTKVETAEMGKRLGNKIDRKLREK